MRAAQDRQGLHLQQEPGSIFPENSTTREHVALEISGEMAQLDPLTPRSPGCSRKNRDQSRPRDAGSGQSPGEETR